MGPKMTQEITFLFYPNEVTRNFRALHIVNSYGKISASIREHRSFKSSHDIVIGVRVCVLGA